MEELKDLETSHDGVCGGNGRDDVSSNSFGGMEGLDGYVEDSGAEVCSCGDKMEGFLVVLAEFQGWVRVGEEGREGGI